MHCSTRNETRAARRDGRNEMRCFRHFNLHEAEGTASAVYSLDLSPGGDTLATCGGDSLVRLWSCGVVFAGGGNDDAGAFSRFVFNHVHGNGRETDDGLCDFGGYHGATGGSTLPLYMAWNVFHNITAYANGGSGMYFDVSSTAWQVSNNLVYDVTNAALKWNVNPGVPQAWAPGGAAAPMRFTNNVLVAERDNASEANEARSATA